MACCGREVDSCVNEDMCVWEASLDHESRDQESGVMSRKC